MKKLLKDWPIILLVLMLAASGIWMAVYSPKANAWDVGIGAGIGYCSGGDHADAYNYCAAGAVTKLFARTKHTLSESVEFEVEVYHFSHPEKEDLHRSQWSERTWDQDGITANIIYWF